MGGREGGRNNRGSSGDGNGGSTFFGLVIDPSDERPQVCVLHIIGENELDNPRNRAREVRRGGEVLALSIDHDGVPVWSRTSGRSGSGVFSYRGSTFKGELAISNLGTINEPVTVLSIALVTAHGAGVDHSDRIVSIEGDARINGGQCKVRRIRDLIFGHELTRSDASKTLEVGGEDCSRLECWNGDGNELCVLEMGFNAFQLELRGLRESDRKEGANNEEGTESHMEGK